MTRTDRKIIDGLHVLLVEDQSLIALDTEAMLLELGAAKVEAVNSAASALQWLASARPDIGVLDINLGALFSFGVGEELTRQKVPFVFTTGYGDALMVPEEFSHIAIVRKPYTREALQKAVETCLLQWSTDDA